MKKEFEEVFGKYEVMMGGRRGRGGFKIGEKRRDAVRM